MRSANVLTMLAGVLILVTIIYLTKHPHTRGEPFSRTDKLMMIPLFVSFCLLFIGGYLMFVRS